MRCQKFSQIYLYYLLSEEVCISLINFRFNYNINKIILYKKNYIESYAIFLRIESYAIFFLKLTTCYNIVNYSNDLNYDPSSFWMSYIFKL